MKTLLLALLPVLWLTSCADTGVRVTQTDVATGAVNPKAIYIRPFRVCAFDHCSPSGDRELRASLAPVEFANDLQEELAKIAPSRVLEPGEAAPVGWLVDGEFESVESGYSREGCWPWNAPLLRPSCVKLHVCIREANRPGAVLYAFNVTAKTKANAWGGVTKPGMGYPLPFDFRNTAEQIALSLTPDPFRYGVRISPAQRY